MTEERNGDTAASEEAPAAAPERAKKLSECRFSECEGAGRKILWLLNYVFIDGMSGMALGLFATLIAGTIIWQVGQLIDKAGANPVGLALEAVGRTAQIAMGCGIGVGVCIKLKKTSPLVVASACAAGMISSYAGTIIGMTYSDGVYSVGGGILGAMENNAAFAISVTGAGDPMGAFIGAISAMAIAGTVSGKTKVDILVTPLAGILGGSVVGLAVGFPVWLALNALGAFIVWVQTLGAVAVAIMGMIIAVVMGVALTLPISSAAICAGLGLVGLAGGACVAGCSAHMVGFAVASYRENGVQGLLSQGLGTSMLQVPNLVKKPILWLPPVVASIVNGPIATCLFKLQMNGAAINSGMGTSGLCGQIGLITGWAAPMCEENAALGVDFAAATANPVLNWIGLVVCSFVIPALVSWLVSEFMRKKGWIKEGDYALDL